MNKKSLTLRRQTVRPLSRTSLGRPRGGMGDFTKTQEDTMSLRNCQGESAGCPPDEDRILSVQICHPSALGACGIPGPTMIAC